MTTTTDAARCTATMTGEGGIVHRCTGPSRHEDMHYSRAGYTWGARGQAVPHSDRDRASTISMSITTPQDVRKSPTARLDLDLVGIGYLVVEFTAEEFRVVRKEKP